MEGSDKSPGIILKYFKKTNLIGLRKFHDIFCYSDITFVKVVFLILGEGYSELMVRHLILKNWAHWGVSTLV